jgi:hypothetical protein
MVAGGHRLDHLDRPARPKPGEQDRRLDLRRRLGVDEAQSVEMPPWIVSGIRSPALASTPAPISRSGPSTRPIGRPLKLSSPVKVTEIGKPAAAPINNRAPVPLLPQ